MVFAQRTDSQMDGRSLFAIQGDTSKNGSAVSCYVATVRFFFVVKNTISCLCKTLCMLVLHFVFVESSVYGEVPCGIAR